MVSYIGYVVSEIGSVYAWDVVNEAVDNQNDVFIKPTEWAEIPDFLCKAFAAAKSTGEGRVNASFLKPNYFKEALP